MIYSLQNKIQTIRSGFKSFQKWTFSTISHPMAFNYIQFKLFCFLTITCFYFSWFFSSLCSFYLKCSSHKSWLLILFGLQGHRSKVSSVIFHLNWLAISFTLSVLNFKHGCIRFMYLTEFYTQCRNVKKKHYYSTK